MLLGRFIQQLHELAGLDRVVDRSAGLDLLGCVGQEVAHLAGIHIDRGIIEGGSCEHAVAGGIQLEAAAVLQSNAGLVAGRIDRMSITADMYSSRLLGLNCLLQMAGAMLR